MAVNKNGIVVLGAIFVDIKGFPEDIYVPDGRNAGHVEYIHGGVSRNVVEDIANLELRPTFLGIADNTALGEDVVRKLQRHKVNTEYMKEIPNGMGTWLAVFDHNGAGRIHHRYGNHIIRRIGSVDRTVPVMVREPPASTRIGVTSSFAPAFA